MHKTQHHAQFWPVSTVMKGRYNILGILELYKRTVSPGHSKCYTDPSSLRKHVKTMHRKYIMKQNFVIFLTVLLFWLFFSSLIFFAFKTLHTFSPPCRNRTLAKLQDAQNVTPTLHHWGNTSKLCMVLSFMHRKDIKENPISTTATAPIRHMIPNLRTAPLASSVVDTVIQVPIIKEWTRGPHIQLQSYCSLHQITKLP